MMDSCAKTLARNLRRAGRRGKHVDAVMRIALEDLPKALSIVGVDQAARDDVGAMAILAVWDHWVPEARQRLADGRWTEKDLPRKMRGALCHWIRRRARDVLRGKARAGRSIKREIEREQRRECERDCEYERERTRLRDQARTSINGMSRLELTHGEWNFATGVASGGVDALRAVGPEHALTAIEIMVAVRRAVGSPRLRRIRPRKSKQLLSDVLSALEARR